MCREGSSVRAFRLDLVHERVDWGSNGRSWRRPHALFSIFGVSYSMSFFIDHSTRHNSSLIAVARRNELFSSGLVQSILQYSSSR